jgi:hypothetical protein
LVEDRASRDGAVNNRYRVRGEQALSDYDSPGAGAYDVQDLDGSGGALMALVCEPRVPARRRSAQALAGQRISNLIELVAAGPAALPHLGGRRLALIYRRPEGERLAAPGAAPTRPMAEERVANGVVRPIATALRALHDHGLTHGGVRPDNLFFTNTDSTRALLGDCLSTPEGWAQPGIFEPVGRSMADRSGRGPADPPTDFFALGVTTLALLLGRDPNRGYGRAALIQARMRDGSFATLVGETKLSLGLKALLVGLLDDDPRTRWDANAIMRWAEGNPDRRPRVRDTAEEQRPFAFLDGEYRQPRTLAAAFCEDPAAAATQIRGEALLDWLRGPIRDRDMAKEIAALAAPNNRRFDDRMLSDQELAARVAMILDPQAPIRYRDLAIMPGGLGPALAAAVADPADGAIDTLRELIRRGVHFVGLSGDRGPMPDDDDWPTTFRVIQVSLGKDEPGFGVERCLYDLNPDIPCQSTMLIEHDVAEEADLLPTLDRLGAGELPKNDPMDRHIAAFVANRMNLSSPDALADLAHDSLKPEQHRLAVLRLLAMVHKRTGRPKVAHLTQWLGSRLGVAVEGLKNRELRKDVGDRLKKVGDSGDLSAMAQLLDDRKMRRSDQAGFAKARQDYALQRRRIDELRSGGALRAQRVTNLGRDIAAIAGYVAVIATVGFVIATYLA